MKKNEYTKQMIASKLKILSKEMPLKAVTVQKLTNTCGINRGTFYYHFYDMRELINWIYHSEITQPARDVLATSLENWSRISVDGLTRMHEDREFYQRAVEPDEPNGLAAYIQREIEANWSMLVDRYVEELYPDADRSAIQLDFIANFLANGAYGMLMKWITGGMKEAPELLSELLDSVAYQGLRSAVELSVSKQGKKREEQCR